MEIMWRLTRRWYGDRLDPMYSPPTREALQHLLGSVGLRAGFWRLEAN
jgi:hypothetical protein